MGKLTKLQWNNFYLPLLNNGFNHILAQGIHTLLQIYKTVKGNYSCKGNANSTKIHPARWLNMDHLIQERKP